MPTTEDNKWIELAKRGGLAGGAALALGGAKGARRPGSGLYNIGKLIYDKVRSKPDIYNLPQKPRWNPPGGFGFSEAPLTTGDVEDISGNADNEGNPNWLGAGLAGAGALAGYGLRKPAAPLDEPPPQSTMGPSVPAAQAVGANKPYGIGMGFTEYVGDGGSVADDPSKKRLPLGGGPATPRGGPPPPGTTPVAPPEWVTPGQEHRPLPPSPPPPPATPPNMGTGYGRRDTSKGPREQVDSVFTPVTDPSGGPVVGPDVRPLPGRQPSITKGPQEQADSRVRSYDGIVPNPQPEPPPGPPNISTGYGPNDGGITEPEYELPPPIYGPIPPPPQVGSPPPYREQVDSTIQWNGLPGNPGDPQYQDGGDQAGRIPGQFGDTAGGNSGTGNVYGSGGIFGTGASSDLNDRIWGSWGYRKGGRVFGEVIANLGEDLGKEESVDEFEDVVPSSKAPEYARLTLENGVAPDPAEIPDQPHGNADRPPILAAPPAGPPPPTSPPGRAFAPPSPTPRGQAALPQAPDAPFAPAGSYAAEGGASALERTAPLIAEQSPVPGRPPATQVPGRRVELPAALPAAKSPSILRRVLAGAVAGAAGISNARGGRGYTPIDTSNTTQAILYPGRAAQVAQHKQDTQRAKDQVALETQQENTASLKEQRESMADYRRTQGELARGAAQDRDDARAAGIRRTDDDRSQRAFDAFTKGRAVIYRREGEIAPDGWEPVAINNPSVPAGFRAYAPSGVAKVPKELVPYLPGYKEGQSVDRKTLDDAADTFRLELKQRNVQDNKPVVPVQNRDHWIATLNDLKASPEARQTAKANLDEDDKRTKANRPPPTPGIALTPEAVEYWAKFAGTTGVMPPMGNGASGAAARQSILNAAPGVGGDVATNRAVNRADSGSLAKMTGMRDAVVAFERTASANLDIFVKAAKPIIDSGSPLVNTPLREINERLLGGTELAAYNAARKVALIEIAKVTNNPNLTGQLSDSARHEVESLVPANASLAQIYAVVNVLRQDMANRRTFLDQGIAETKGRMSGGGAAASHGSVAAPAGYSPNNPFAK